MLSMLRRLSISRQIQLAGIILILSAFVTTAGLVYREASRILLDSAVRDQERQAQALAESLSGRYAATIDLAKQQLEAFFADKLPRMRLETTVETIKSQPVRQLTLGGEPVSGMADMVDTLQQATGSYVTVFVKQGNDFLRVMTALKTQDGARATGTWLGAKHPGYPQLMRGESFHSIVSLFGKRYLTYYTPFKDATGQAAGLLFIGIPIESIVSDIFSSLKNIVWGQTGYTVVLDAAEERRGTYLMFPDDTYIGRSVLDTQLQDGSKPFKAFFEKPSGTLMYKWTHKGINDQKAMAFAYVPGWDWKLLGGTFVSEITRDSKILLKQIAVTALIACTLIILCLTLLLRNILAPLERLTSQLVEFGSGNISQQIDNVDASSRNEIHRLATGLDNMGKSLQRLVSQMRNSGTQLDETALSLQSTADSSRLELADMGEQTNQLATAIEEMASSAASVAEQAELIASQVRDAKQETDGGTVVVQQMVGEMARLGENLEQSAEAIHRVDQQSCNIHKVTRMIDEIAEQTNLLALNAAIEAARAGEQGRGFAVVADEVRQLAHRTQQSVQEVVTIINQLQESTRSAVDLMDLSRKMGEQVGERARETGQALTGIAGQVDTIATMSESISATAEEQAMVSQELAAGVTQVRDLSESNLQGAQRTVDSAQAVTRESKSLNEQVAYFC